MYNNRMENSGPQVIHSERNAPKRAIIRSDGALYVLLLITTIGAIILAYTLSRQFGVNRLYVQLGLYAALLILGYAIYRLRLVDYIYEVTPSEFRVVQAVGEKKKPLVRVPLDAITEVGTYRETDAKPGLRTYRGARKNTTAIWYTEEGQKQVVCLNASDTLRDLLSEAAHANG